MASTTSSRRASQRFLPPDPRIEAPYRLTPQLLLRVGILGALALLVFAVLFLRLWALQILSANHYLDTALNNQLREVRIAAQRGSILDRNGHVLVTNVPGTQIQLWPSDLPKNGRFGELRRLAKIVGVPLAEIDRRIARHRGDPVTPITIEVAAPEDQVRYLREHEDDFPGVQVAEAFLRKYPYHSLLAQVLGHVGEISPEQLKHNKNASVKAGDTIGQGGVEATYDSYLRGTPGLAQLRVDSLGRPRSPLTPVANAAPGHAVRLTIDVGLQRAAEQALRYGIDLGRRSGCIGCWSSNGGAIVALDPRDGSILALASNPTYKPSVYSGRVVLKNLAQSGLTNPTAETANYPALNRAVAGQYPAGSTFKPVTALAALQEHLVYPYESLPCTGSYEVRGDNGVVYTFRNWDPFVSTQMSLATALAASCDTYFYRLGYKFYVLPGNRGHPLQAWASRFGFGQLTGVDIAGETTGLMPTPEWRQATYTKKRDRCCWQVDRLWKPGDSIQLAIGQKDMLVTPLQMARFYALVANGGKLVQPHVVMDVEQPGMNGSPARVLPAISPRAPQPTGVDPNALAVVRQGLYDATHATYGTSSGVFGSFPIPIAGKTGTAEKAVSIRGIAPGQLIDQSWWCGYGPADNARLVVCALIENAGHGGTAAAPAALRVFEQFFGTKALAQSTVNTD